ncbi:hypothetical protein SAMN02745781_02763 [Vibrio gazogenes DSM 21264]|uniref:Uncharacterized protein n=1 Tax=Vibrio gazogenes DSM 21264 = NBRC 103151 TaxID=1123492 RepID=A0A1M5D4A3_VIBGA|nr:hypothetical protein SAMN02745781_02763 [Vibrio gazogenes DSM 21264] [Vibrio gazogenes DSM 21264 = NBRC 103151]SJN54962.1 hypothetical protein BQ6471_01297 [Vibrio gazogenes]
MTSWPTFTNMLYNLRTLSDGKQRQSQYQERLILPARKGNLGHTIDVYAIEMGRPFLPTFSLNDAD